MYKMTSSYKEIITVENLQVKPPVKNENKQWVCEVLYNHSPFLIQTPRIRIIKEIGTLVFKVPSKQGFLDYLSSIEDALVKIIANNSARFFFGKKFSLVKIKDSLSPSWDIDDDGFVYLHPSNTEKDLTNINCLDMLNDKISYEDIQENVSAIVNVESVIFTKKAFKVVYKINSLKMTKFVESHDMNPFKEDTDENIEEGLAKVEITSPEEENAPEEENVSDSADFFD